MQASAPEGQRALMLSETTRQPTAKEFSVGIPARTQQVLISWIFIFASVTLLLDFLALQALISATTWTGKYAAYGNWFGVVSCILWVLGFIILAHWLHGVGATVGGKAGCYLKIVASVLFNLQPMTGTAGIAGGAGLWWSNLAGISFFHVGNLVSCFDFWMNTPPGADKKLGWGFPGNLPITGMWVYQLATWFLVYANIADCSWGAEVPKPMEAINSWSVFATQVAGALCLLLGSLIYCHWCDGYKSFWDAPQTAPAGQP